MTNKEEILITKNDVFKFIDEKPPTLRNRAILKDMIEDVAKQVAIEVLKLEGFSESAANRAYSLWEQTKK